MILCIGLAADDTFRHTLEAIARSGIAFDVVDVAQLAFSGDVHIPLDNLPEAQISLHGKVYRLQTYQSAFVRLLDISDGAPNLSVAKMAVGMYESLSCLFNYSPIPVLNPLRDKSNS